MSESKPVGDYTYIVWINYGTEGWRPKFCNTEEEVIQVATRDNAGSETLITRSAIPLTLAEME